MNTAERDQEIERLRERYRPATIRTLFVGESRPASGKFCYDPKLRPIAQRFEKALELGGDDFLHSFKDAGLYLDDLVLTPINGCRKSDRQRLRLQAVPGLKSRIRKYRPALVVAIMKGIAPFVREAAEGIAWVEVVPFPGNGHQREFLIEMQKLRSAILGCPAPN